GSCGAIHRAGGDESPAASDEAVEAGDESGQAGTGGAEEEARRRLAELRRGARRRRGPRDGGATKMRERDTEQGWRGRGVNFADRSARRSRGREETSRVLSRSVGAWRAPAGAGRVRCGSRWRARCV